jgi:plasmid stability protein
MSVTITLTDPLAEQLRIRAKRQHLQVEELVFTILKNALQPANQNVLTPEEVVAKIKATPPTPKNIRPATGSLLEALRNAPDYPDFDLETWEKEWADVEREMKAVTRANALAEGRG